MEKILIIEDEHDIAELISFNLERSGFDPVKAHDGITGVEKAFSESPNLIILDLMLPGKDGFAVFKDLRRDPRTQQTPVIMLTAKAQTEDRIRGLESGADDYLIKPFSPKELVLRVKSILNRSNPSPGMLEFSAGPFRFDKNSMSFFVDHQPVDLTSTEFKLMVHLVERPGKAQSRSDLLRTVWGYSDDVHSRTLDTHMKRLRQKLEDRADMIETVRGVGYRLRPLSELEAE